MNGQGIKPVAKLNPAITQGFRKEEDKFGYNKDADMFVCPAGHMAIRKARQGKKNRGKNQADTYYFDVEKCKVCPLREGCYRPGAKAKTYAVTIKSDLHREQIAFQETTEYKESIKHRYKIEAKNSELKNVHGWPGNSLWHRKHADAGRIGHLYSQSEKNYQVDRLSLLKKVT